MSTEEKFLKFHAENPGIYEYLKRQSIRLYVRRVRHWTIRNLWECMRMDRAIRTNGKPWKLDNNFTRFYVRMLMENEPRLRGFFETRN